MRVAFVCLAVLGMVLSGLAGAMVADTSHRGSLVPITRGMSLAIVQPYFHLGTNDKGVPNYSKIDTLKNGYCYEYWHKGERTWAVQFCFQSPVAKPFSPPHA